MRSFKLGGGPINLGEAPLNCQEMNSIHGSQGVLGFIFYNGRHKNFSGRSLKVTKESSVRSKRTPGLPCMDFLVVHYKK